MRSFFEVEVKCESCGLSFWRATGKQGTGSRQKLAQENRCPRCRDEAANQAAIKAIAVKQDDHVGATLPEARDLFGDVSELVKKSTEPVRVTPRTVWEWLDPGFVTKQVNQKLLFGNIADSLIEQRLRVINRAEEIRAKQWHAEQEEMTRRRQRLEEDLKLLRLQEEMEQLEALRQARLTTQRLEETRKQKELLDSMQPPEPEPAEPVADEDPLTTEAERHRSYVRARTGVKLSLLSDALEQIRDIFTDAFLERGEKTARIHAVLDTYNLDLDALPDEVCDFLEGTANPDDGVTTNDGA